MTDSKANGLSRRAFVKQGTAGLAATAAAANLAFLDSNAFAQAGDKGLGIGLIGCGGRGGGAVKNCLNAAKELGIQVKLVAVADLAADRVDRVKRDIQGAWTANYAVTDETTFTGFDAYKKLCAHPDVDVVIQATPPGLRYLTLREAVKNGKHSFVEKPVCVDTDTYKHVLESGKMADENGLAIVSGTQYRREASYVQAIEALNEGVIGEVTNSYQYYCGGTQWHLGNGEKKDAEGNIVTPKWDEMTYQMRNWPYYTWLSGDLIAEQSIHNIDAINWSMGGAPKWAYASGGRIDRTQPDYGNIYDHFSVHFEWANGVRSSFMGRHYSGSRNKVENRWTGTKGTLDLSPSTSRSRWFARDFDGKVLARGTAAARDSYVEEHVALLDGIVNNNVVQEIQEVADSSLTCIMGREAAYSGQQIDFDFLAGVGDFCKLKLRPDGIDGGPKAGDVKLPFAGVRTPASYEVPGFNAYEKWKKEEERKRRQNG